jgi:hypothetical protein
MEGPDVTSHGTSEDDDNKSTCHRPVQPRFNYGLLSILQS